MVTITLEVMCQASPKYNSCPHGGLRQGAVGRGQSKLPVGTVQAVSIQILGGTF